ncbi:MAG: hypothetical protein PVI54_11840 [Desulfobacteraceae bacterium]|jgi:hypothetical protein
MKLMEESISAGKRCDLCELVMNPTVNIYSDDCHLCNTCFREMENMPEVVAKSVERFLIGNVV